MSALNLKLMPKKIVSTALEAKDWTFEAKVKAIPPKVEAIKFGFVAKAWPQVKDYITGVSPASCTAPTPLHTEAMTLSKCQCQ